MKYFPELPDPGLKYARTSVEERSTLGRRNSTCEFKELRDCKVLLG